MLKDRDLKSYGVKRNVLESIKDRFYCWLDDETKDTFVIGVYLWFCAIVITIVMAGWLSGL